jgi:hypothetical protein
MARVRRGVLHLSARLGERTATHYRGYPGAPSWQSRPGYSYLLGQARSPLAVPPYHPGRRGRTAVWPGASWPWDEALSWPFGLVTRPATPSSGYGIALQTTVKWASGCVRMEGEIRKRVPLRLRPVDERDRHFIRRVAPPGALEDCRRETTRNPNESCSGRPDCNPASLPGSPRRCPKRCLFGD